MHEKLIELINEAEEWADHKCDELECEKCPADKMKGNCVQQLMFDRLIANGVTLQKWIPVTERLPDENGYYLCVVCVSSVNQRKEYRRMILFWEDNVWIDMANCFRTKKPLYWMPLPDPPKGE